MDDDELIAAVAAGDHVALRELFERHAPWVAGRLRRSLPVDAVEDVVQETFIAVWRGADSYTGRGKAGAWLWGIARRQTALWYRRNGRALPDIQQPLIDAEADAVTRLDVQRALSNVGPEGSEPRQLAEIVLIEDRPLAEAADRLGIPVGTVKSRMFKLRGLLREALRGSLGV